MSVDVGNTVGQMNIAVPPATAIVTLDVPGDNEFSDRLAQVILSTAVVHRGAQGIRIWSLVSPEDRFRTSFRVFFPVTAPTFLRSASNISISALTMDYRMRSTAGSVARIEILNGSSVLDSITDIPHTGGSLNVVLKNLKRFRLGLGVALVLDTPTGRPVGITVSRLEIALASPTVVGPAPT